MFTFMPVFLFILGPILLGVLGLVVFGLIYGITHKRPGVAVAAVLVPLAVLVGCCLLGLLVALVGRSSTMVASATPAQVNWSVEPAMPSMPPMPPLYAMPAAPQFHWSVIDAASWAKLAFVLLICFGVAKLFSKGASGDGQRRGGWGKTVVAALLIILALNFLWLRLSFEPREMAEAQRQAELQRDEQARRNAEAVKKIRVDHRQQADAALQRANDVLASRSMQEMWEKLNQPRIMLDGVKRDAVVKTNDEAMQVTLAAPQGEGEVASVSSEDKSSESLARSLERLEHMVEQVSAMADKVSDTGTMIGKAVIALNETIDSRSRAKTGTAPTTAGTTVETVAEVDHPVVVATPVLAELELPPRRETIEIVFHADKLSQFSTTFENIKDMLGRDGLWLGKAVRFVPEEGRIVVTGDIGNNFATRLSSALISTVGKDQAPIHLSDVATVTSEHGEMSRDVAGWTRPAWVDEPPKRIGNVWREVVETEEYATTDECARAADVYLLLKTYEYFQQLSGMPHGENTLPSLTFRAQDHAIMTTDGYVIFHQDGNSGYWHDPRILALQAMGIDLDFIRREIVPANREYYETVERSFGPMKKLYTQIEFTPSIDRELRRRWDEVRRQDRFAAVGAGAGSVLGLISLAFGLLRVDTWTKGYYSKRLFLGVPAAIITVVGLLSLAVGI